MNITLNEIETVLDYAGLKHKRSAEKIICQCPMHADPSSGLNCEISENGFAFCHSRGCHKSQKNGFWLDEVFPQLKENKDDWKNIKREMKPEQPKPKQPKIDLMDLWLDLEPLTENVPGKSIPFEFLNKLGWRKWKHWGSIGEAKYPEGWFIPYFGATGKTMPYAQIRHDKNASWQDKEAIRRFSFIKNCTPIWHGLESLERCKDFVCFTEGSSDRAVLEFAGIPCLGLPAGKSKDKVFALAKWCMEHNKCIVYCGDNDQVGDDLLEAIDKMKLRYRIMRPPQQYKDYGDMFEAKGIASIQRRLSTYLVGERKKLMDTPFGVGEEMSFEEAKQKFPALSLFDGMEPSYVTAG